MLSLPSLGELDQGLRVRVFLCTSPTDMRKGFDTLAVLVREGSGYDPLSGHLIYRAGVALLDADRPHKLLARSPGWIFQAEAPYEVSGLVPNVVFRRAARPDRSRQRLGWGAARART